MKLIMDLQWGGYSGKKGYLFNSIILLRYYAYQISSIALLYLVGMILFLLSANMLYPFLEYIGAVGSSRDMKFDSFSF